MTYIGQIRHGVVVLEGNPSLKEGTVVRVEVEPDTSEDRPGSARAVLRHAGAWENVRDEVDQLLFDLYHAKQEELRAQQSGSGSAL